MKIHLANAQGLDAEIVGESARTRIEKIMVDPDNLPARSVRVLRGTTEQDLAAIMDAFGPSPEAIADALISSDVDVDSERFGALLTNTSRVYVTTEGEVARSIRRFEVVYSPSGEPRTRRPRQRAEQNVAAEIPLAWTGSLVPRREAVRRFAFTRSIQLRHRNGLEYDFLYRMAERLDEADALMIVGAGPSGRDPLILQRGGRPYRGFLDGRVRTGGAYLLMLHLTNLELKPPSAETDGP